jgi:signal transduction histidine kinase
MAPNSAGRPNSYQPGVGINSIRERAIQLGGNATITASPGRGTTVLARLPITEL